MIKFLSILCSVLSFQLNAQVEFDYRQFTKSMCSPQFQGRGYVHGGDSIAAEYIAQAFSNIDVAPVTKDYFQYFSFPVNTFPDTCSIFLGGNELIPGKDFVANPISGGTCHDIDCQPKQFDVHHISGGTFLAYSQANRIASLKLDEQDILVVDNSMYSRDSTQIIRYFIKKYAQTHPVIETLDEKFTWSVSTYQIDNLYLQMQASLFKNLIKGLKISIHLRNHYITNHVAKNVIGLIPSRKKSKGTIFLSAHYDHLGKLGSKAYFPGANDNASGVAMMLKLAEKIEAKPLKKYDVLCVAFAGEEIGLLGSKHLSENTIIPLDKIKFQLNMDIMGSGEKGITAVNGSVFKKEFKKLQKLNKKLDVVPVIKARGKASNSDHHYFTEKGVDGFFIYTMGNNQNYHDIYDTYEALSFSSFEGLSLLFEKFIRRL